MWTVTSDRSTIWSSLNDDMMISFLFMWNGKSFNDNAFSYTHHFTINFSWRLEICQATETFETSRRLEIH